jgi:hypothetical protein
MEVVLLNGGVRNLQSLTLGVGRSDLRSLCCTFSYNIWIASRKFKKKKGVLNKWIANSTSLTIFKIQVPLMYMKALNYLTIFYEFLLNFC